MPAAATTLDRLELRIERLRATFRFTYAFHAREVRFECDRGDGYRKDADISAWEGAESERID